MSANLNILRRFVIYMAILTFVMFTVWAFVKSFMNRPPGDYETEVCDIRLKDKLYEEAIEAANNALIGDSEEIIKQIKERFHPEDRLMTWFDFFNHDSERVCRNMSSFMKLVAPHFTK